MDPRTRPLYFLGYGIPYIYVKRIISLPRVIWLSPHLPIIPHGAILSSDSFNILGLYWVYIGVILG